MDPGGEAGRGEIYDSEHSVKAKSLRNRPRSKERSDEAEASEKDEVRPHGDLPIESQIFCEIHLRLRPPPVVASCLHPRILKEIDPARDARRGKFVILTLSERQNP